MPEFRTVMVLSTSTLEEDVSDMLTEMGEDVDQSRHFGDWRDHVPARCGYAFGHWVRVPEALDGETAEEVLAPFPKSLQDGMRFAAGYGCTWILYDRDGEPQGLTEYEW